MATYSNRITELRDLMSQAATGAEEPVIKLLSDCIGKYADMRQRTLDDLLDLVSKASISNLGTQEKWKSRVNSFRGEFNRLFGDAVKDVMLTPALQLFWFSALQAEETFFERLSEVKTPQLLDDMLKHQDGLSKLIAELQDGWKFILSNDQALENDEIRAIRQVDEMVQGIISELDGWHRALIDNAAKAEEAVKRKAENVKERIKESTGPAGEWVESIIKVVKDLILDQIKPDGMPGDFDTQMEAAGQQIELSKQALVERVRLHRSLVQTYRSLVSTEKGGVLTMFRKTKDEVDDYLKNNNVAQAKVWLDEAKGELADWVSELPTSRQKDDAGSFRDDIYKHLDNNWKITEELDKKFREQFQGVFISPLSNETIEALAERYLFKQHMETINGRGGVAKLETHRAMLQAHAEKVEIALRPMDEVASGCPAEIRDLAKMRNTEFKEFVRERIRKQVEALLPVIDDLKGMLEPSNVQNDFSREELEGVLE